MVTTLEPAYSCNLNGYKETCTAADGEIVFSRDSGKKRIKSQALYDWLIVGSKYEVVGPPKEELLEETLYRRFFSVIENEFSDFILCPRIDSIERIRGNSRRHLVTASALNYSGHHDGPYDRIIFTVIDTPEDGIKVVKVKKERAIPIDEAETNAGGDGSGKETHHEYENQAMEPIHRLLRLLASTQLSR